MVFLVCCLTEAIQFNQPGKGGTVNMGNTTENLKAAFAGESQANRRYLFSAGEADKAGQKQVARLFRAATNERTESAT